MNKHKFEIISELDKIRWGDNCEHLIDINYAHKNMTDAEMILTHWLCYITDRQMPYQIIWDVGGFVFSDLVWHYCRARMETSILLEPNGDNSFIKALDSSKTKKDNSQEDNSQESDPSTEYEFRSVQSVPEDNIIKSKYPGKILCDDDTCVCRFRSRFYSVDYINIYYTLSILESIEEKDRSLVSYIARIISTVYQSKNRRKAKDYIRAIASGLYLLSFYNVKNIQAGQIQTAYNFWNGKSDEKPKYRGKVIEGFETLDERKDNIKKWISRGCQDLFDGKKEFDSSKRLWCSLRDYIKSPIFSKKHFIPALKKCLNENNAWKSFEKEVLENNGNNGCRYIELPGDVWNENSIFRRCFEKNDEDAVKANEQIRQKPENKRKKNIKIKFGELLRELRTMQTDNNPPKDWYPEQFDITFDIAPRMCEQNNCKYCILSDEEDRFTNLEKMCINNSGKYCPLVLLHCGYRYVCPGKDECILSKSNYLEADK